MRSPEPSFFPPSEALLHGQFASWVSGNNGSNNNSCPNSPGGSGGISPTASPTLAPTSNYALTLTHAHIHIQRLLPRPGKEARLLLPLSELLGCSCPRAPAPPLLVLYWYPPGKRRKGVSRRRQVRAYMAETRPEAERWSAAVQCLLRGVPVTAETEFSRSLLPRPRRLLLLVNPFSGRGQAMQWCQTRILPMIREANISYNLIQTERQNHARELIREISLPEWDGVIIISGDGLLHEVINGLMERADWEQAIKTPVGILPCGSGNALAGSINHHAGYDMCLREPLLLNCCFLLCRGGVRPMDLVSVTTSPPTINNSRAATAVPRRLFSFLSVAWGFVSDVDIESERYRGLGSARFTLGTLVRIASLRSYKGRLSYLPPSIMASSPDATPPLPRRPLSRSITEGLEGFCKNPIHRTSSDMGISEQRSLRRGEGEQEKEERQRERERRRERARGGGTGVVRASSLMEDREKEKEGEVEMEEERLKGERGDCNMGGDAGLAQIKDEQEDEGRTEEDSSEMEEEHQAGDGKDRVKGEGVVHAQELGEGLDADEGSFTYQDGLQETKQALRKNSAPSSQIANTLFGQADCDSSPSYGVEDMDLNGRYYQKEDYPLDVARERALTISSPFRHSPFSYKPRTVDQNQNSSRPRPLSLLQHSHSNSLPPKLPSLSLSLSPTPPSSPSCASPHSSSYLVPRPNTPGSTSPSPPIRTPSSSFNFDIAEPAGPLKNRPYVTLPLNVPRDDLLPSLDQPLPTRDWITIEGDFVLVLALYQSHLGADLHAAPQARFDDGLIHLTFVRAGISRATLLRLFFAMERGTHHSVSSPYVSHVSCRAFRLQPLSTRGTLTVDGELVPYGPLQAQVHPSMARLIVGDSGLEVTRF
ncbi:sphingosine kinase 2 isoform X1 [Phycodurus eques]|uniref:sphingosine kinase 2 isoform X1 n=2 Tax=Phycodurus eques TaxID=693459 RepID=UPI002ACE85FA|nr:sphingosine kinase 2 isoform X1 [Phycodurus eques]XP_061530536.1 sphingosine kinase 2 isoform X1 [Phycodurus eques]XP_061530537.1 sphingosine kinase 2 isoform X1 [Phycodurus eques]XP_061530538.1 sphingosine kinase 2 isoform X1 [Phycodurus eques]